MKLPRLSHLCLAAVVGLAAQASFADSSTGPNNPTPKGTNPSAVGVPSGTNNGMANGNTDGSAAPPSSANGSNNDLKPQNGDNPEGSSMGKQGQSTMGGSEGGNSGGASK